MVFVRLRNVVDREHRPRGPGICHCSVHVLLDRIRLFQVARPDTFHDLGNLLFAFLMLWAYLSFSSC